MFRKTVMALAIASIAGGALASDEYDARGQLFVAAFDNMTFSYDGQATNTDNRIFYNFTSGSYNISGLVGPYYGNKFIEAQGDVQ